MCNPEDFAKRLDRLRADLVEQGRRVQSLVDSAFEAVFTCDTALADRVVNQDDAIDRVDVDLEKASVRLLSDATVPDSDTSISHANIRTLLTVVKVNNELERIADLGVDVAGRAKGLAKTKTPMPDTIRVMSNSALGIIRDVVRALETSDANLATVVLRSEDTVETFKKAILQDAEKRIAAGELSPGEAFLRHEIANLCERMADHCTNIAEQVIYSATGKIVRHTEGQWEDVTNVAG